MKSRARVRSLTTGEVCEIPARKKRSAMKRQMHRCRWMVVRVPCMERQNLNVRMQSMRHSSEMASPTRVTTWSPKVCCWCERCESMLFNPFCEIRRFVSRHQEVLQTASNHSSVFFFWTERTIGSSGEIFHIYSHTRKLFPASYKQLRALSSHLSV